MMLLTYYKMEFYQCHTRHLSILVGGRNPGDV